MKKRITNILCILAILIFQNALFAQTLTVDLGGEQDVNLTLTDVVSGVETSINGDTFSDLDDGDYTLVGSKDSDHMEGVTTLDLVFMMRHLLELSVFTDPYDYFASDVNGDLNINMMDVVNTRRLILGIDEDFGSLPSWKFGDISQVFNSDLNLILSDGLDEVTEVSIAGADVSKTLEVIKMGNVKSSGNLINEDDLDNFYASEIELLNKSNNIHNDLHHSSSYRGGDTVEVNISSVVVSGQTNVCVPVTVSNFENVSAFQFAVDWDPAMLSYEGIQSDILNVYKNELIVEDGKILFAWSEQSGGDKTLDNNTQLLEFCFTIEEGLSDVAELSFSNTSFQNGVFDLAMERPAVLTSGQVSFEAMCIDDYIAILGFQSDSIEVLATDLYLGETSTDVVLMDGESSITYYCEDIGEQSVDLSITDENGVTETCSITFQVVDITPPIAIVDGEIVVALDNTFTHFFDPSEIDDGSYDNCGAVTLSVNPSFVDCDSSDPTWVTLTVTDETGNINKATTLVTFTYPEPTEEVFNCYNNIEVEVNQFYEVEITADMIITDDLTTCSGYYSVELSDIGGANVQADNYVGFSDVGNTYQVTITDPISSNACVSQVEISFAGAVENGVCVLRPIGDVISGVAINNTYTTDSTGCVIISDLAVGTEITPTMEDDWLDGVDILDVILMYKGVLGMEELTVHQLIAADMNNNGSLTSLDIVLLEKYMDGSLEPTQPSWKFVEGSHVFPPADFNDIPLVFPMTGSFNDSPYGNLFVGMKMGDVDYSYDVASFIEDELPITAMVIKDEILNNGESYELPIKTKSLHALEGIQFSLDYNSDQIEITSINSSTLPGFDPEKHVSIENGVVAIMYNVSSDDIFNGGVVIEKDKALFDISFTAIDNAILNESISLDQVNLNILKAQEQTKPYQLDLEWSEKVINNVTVDYVSSIDLFPVPASNIVHITWTEEQYTDARYTIVNTIGQHVLSGALNNDKINISSLNNGIYTIQLFNESSKIAIERLVVNR